MLLFFYFFWKLADVITSILAPRFIPYLGFFSYGDTMLKYNVPQFIRALSNFDGIFFIRIALNGYSETEQAYFPLYPLLLRFVNYFIQNPIISGVLISNFSFFIGLIVLKKYLQLDEKKYSFFWIAGFMLAYPTSYYFGVMYTESLFFMLFISTLYSLKTKRFFNAFLFGCATALCRVIGVFLFIPLLVYLIAEAKNSESKKIGAIINHSWKYLVVAIAPLLGIALYCYYLWQTTGNPIYFFNAQESFGAHRSTHLILPPQVIYRYIKIFVTANKNFQYFVAVVEFLFYIFALALLTVDLVRQLRKKIISSERLGLNFFSFANIIIPSLTGTLTAIPRYSLLSLSIYFVLAEINNKYIKYSLLIGFFILHIIFLAFFVQGYYIT